MMVDQFVMAYQAEQDRIRALLPEGFSSLRPVLRINGEIRREREGSETLYLEFNTPVAGFGKRGWLNIARWSSPETPITREEDGRKLTFRAPFLAITWTALDLQGGCPAERDNDGCFFPGGAPDFIPAEAIDSPRIFCDCAFRWSFSPEDAQGVSEGKGSIPAFPTEPAVQYEPRPLTPQAAAAIPCQQVLGAYRVAFER